MNIFQSIIGLFKLDLSKQQIYLNTMEQKINFWWS